MWIMEQAEASLATSKQDYSSEDSVKTTIKEEDKDILSMITTISRFASKDKKSYNIVVH